MNYKFAALALAGLLLTQVGFTAFADGDAAAPASSAGNTVWQVLSFPLRIVTGAGGLAIGAVGGSVRGIVNTEEQFAQNTFGKAEENPMLVPVGLVGTVLAVPVGIVTGAPEGAVKGGKYGYHVWDNF
ncbi:MAG: hypothetical protein K0Q50_1455 [Vampirovibrio sp.]|nr:hypothetical protein [Vampirovibrio sp.]